MTAVRSAGASAVAAAEMGASGMTAIYELGPFRLDTGPAC